MTDKEQTMRFADGLDSLVEQYRNEFDLSYACVVGVLTMKAHLLMDESKDQEDDQPYWEENDSVD